MAPATTLEEVTDAQLSRYAKLIYDKTGICISPQKKALLSNRIRRRLRQSGIEGYDAYLKHVKTLPPSDPEWDAFLQEITTHETYLFRDEAHWEWFRREFLTELASDARRGKRDRRLRILSAACSTGDEAYTIATCIAASLTNHSHWNIEIVGTDIGAGALEQAELAAFNQRAMRLVPDDCRRRFFKKAVDVEVWQAKPILSEWLRFRRHNLMQPLRETPFDLVVIKNVLIYFDTESKKKVLGHLLPLVRPGGYLLCGAAEGVNDLLGDLTRLRPWLHRRA